MMQAKDFGTMMAKRAEKPGGFEFDVGKWVRNMSPQAQNAIFGGVLGGGLGGGLGMISGAEDEDENTSVLGQGLQGGILGAGLGAGATMLGGSALNELGKQHLGYQAGQKSPAIFGETGRGAARAIGESAARAVPNLSIPQMLARMSEKRNSAVKRALCNIVTKSTKTVRMPSIHPSDHQTPSTNDMAKSKDRKGARPVIA